MKKIRKIASKTFICFLGLGSILGGVGGLILCFYAQNNFTIFLFVSLSLLFLSGGVFLLYASFKDIRSSNILTKIQNFKIITFVKKYIQVLSKKAQVRLIQKTSLQLTSKPKILPTVLMKIQDEHGMDHITFHDLRHLNASVMALLRIPDKYAQERGGWKSDKVMKDIYM